MSKTLFHNVMVLDATGAEPFSGSVLVEGNRRAAAEQPGGRNVAEPGVIERLPAIAGVPAARPTTRRSPPYSSPTSSAFSARTMSTDSSTRSRIIDSTSRPT